MKRLCYILLVLAAVLALSGCGASGIFRSPGEIPVDQTLSSPAQAAQKALNTANVTLTAAYRVVGQNRDANIYTKEKALAELDKLDVLGKQVDKAQTAFNVGNFDFAKLRAEFLRDAIMEIRKAAEAARRGS